MSDIKFRGVTARGCMVFGHLANDKEGSTHYWKDYSQRICWYPESGGCANAPVRNGTVGQFTGITNSNGDELYEGDVIDIQGHIATICCENSYREFYFWNEICNEYMGLAFLIGYKSFKIIGNIHQNPELLGEE